MNHNQSPMIQKRSLMTMLLLVIITFGFYTLYWLYKTKNEINSLGGSIPPVWFAILPFFNIYFDLRYAQDLVRFVRRSDNDIMLELALFCALLCLPVISIFIIQYELNNYALHHVHKK